MLILARLAVIPARLAAIPAQRLNNPALSNREADQKAIFGQPSFSRMRLPGCPLKVLGFLHLLEIAVGVDLEFPGCRLVTDNPSVGVALE